MAAIEKCSNNEVIYHLRHNSRENPRTPGNPDIDPSRRGDNYYLTPNDHGRSARECRMYYKKRLSEIYVFGRSDVVTACEWVVTAPKDLNPDQYDAFFRASYEFLNSLYGEQNCIQAVVHNDEGVKDYNGQIVQGKAHMHYLFIPAVKNQKYMKPTKSGNLTLAAKFPEKLCAYELIDKNHLKQFHPKLQKWLNDAGIKCTVHSGVTGGKSKTVEQLKTETKALLKERERSCELEAENRELKERLAANEKSFEKPTGWSQSWGWSEDNVWNLTK